MSARGTSQPSLDRGFQAQLRDIYLDRDARCPRCRYHLRGVPGPRCPECGSDIADFLRVADTTGWRLQRARLRWLARRMLSWAALIALLGAGVIVAVMYR
jgi:hypothetical protein